MYSSITPCSNGKDSEGKLWRELKGLEELPKSLGSWLGWKDCVFVGEKSVCYWLWKEFCLVCFDYVEKRNGQDLSERLSDIILCLQSLNLVVYWNFCCYCLMNEHIALLILFGFSIYRLKKYVSSPSLLCFILFSLPVFFPLTLCSYTVFDQKLRSQREPDHHLAKSQTVIR